jgi:hypothetical protein
MNFFQRRLILKKANYLHLTPVRMMEFQVDDAGKVNILMPRFKNKFWRTVYRESKKGEFINIHLDETGSAIWLLIDGKESVETIFNALMEKSPEKFSSPGDLQKRITQFMSLLYHQRYISFREILVGSELSTMK